MCGQAPMRAGRASLLCRGYQVDRRVTDIRSEFDQAVHTKALKLISEGGYDTGSIAAEAERLVNGKRAEQYGNPPENMARIGVVWGALLGRDAIPARTVAVMMAALKLARECGPEPKRDNLVDACGYLLIAEQCE